MEKSQMNKEQKNKTEPQEQHLCSECFEVSKGFYRVANERKVCVLCGGTVLDSQEAADKIAELRSDVSELEDKINGNFEY